MGMFLGMACSMYGFIMVVGYLRFLWSHSSFRHAKGDEDEDARSVV